MSFDTLEVYSPSGYFRGKIRNFENRANMSQSLHGISKNLISNNFYKINCRLL